MKREEGMLREQWARGREVEKAKLRRLPETIMLPMFEGESKSGEPSVDGKDQDNQGREVGPHPSPST